MISKNSVSICVPAYNEEKNISKILDALINQITDKVHINKIVVVSSASTDNTDNVVKDFCKQDSRVHLIQQKKREGKASAINAFLKFINDEIVVIESADTIPQPNTIEHLCLPLLNDKSIGMTGGAPIPVNDPKTFLGYIIHTWWWFHRNIPRFGEIIAYRNIIKALSTTTAVDEAYIQAKMIQLSLKAVHVDEAIVFNKGAEHIKDLIMQRRRVYNGHARLYRHESIKIDNMTKSTLQLLLFKFPIHSPRELVWLIGGILVEVYAQFLGMVDLKISKKNPFIWDTARSTKNLKKGQAYDFIA
jgi:cellulose synthase/poly-beta-1,6-N-acetylglucosamine synthase-like glycosyltransferase